MCLDQRIRDGIFWPSIPSIETLLKWSFVVTFVSLMFSGLFNNSMDSCGGGANSDTDLDLDLKTEVSALATGRNEVASGHHGHISRQPAKSRPSGQTHQRPRSASSSVVDHVLVADMAGSRYSEL